MTDRVNPSGIRAADPLITAGAIRYGGDDWVVEPGVDYFATEDGLSGAPLGSFQVSNTNGLTLTVDTGEAFVGGAYLGRDETTDVDLQEQVDSQTIYLGWRPKKTNMVVIGRDDASQSAFQASDPRIPIIEADTNGTSITSARFVGPLGEPEHIRSDTEDEVGASTTWVGASPIVQLDEDDTERYIPFYDSDGNKIGHYGYSSGEYPGFEIRNLLGEQGVLRIDDRVYINQPLDSNGEQLKNVGSPSDSSDAATKGYVQSGYIPQQAEQNLNVSNADTVDGFHQHEIGRTYAVPLQQATIPPREWTQTIVTVPDGHRLLCNGFTYRNPEGNVANDLRLVVKDLNADTNIYEDENGGDHLGIGPGSMILDNPVDGYADLAFRFSNTNNNNERVASGIAYLEFREL